MKYQSLSSGKSKLKYLDSRAFKIWTLIFKTHNSDFLIPLRRQTHPKHDIRDRGKPLLTSFAEAKDFPFFLTRDRGTSSQSESLKFHHEYLGTGVEYKVNIIGEFSTSSDSEWPKLRNLYIKCSS